MEHYNQGSVATNGKEFGQTTEASKKRRSARKKSDVKPIKITQETSEITLQPEYIQDLNTDLAQYTYKLEFELRDTRSKLKNQRKNFQKLLKSLTLYFDAKGITPQMIDEYVKGVVNQLGDESDEEEEDDELLRLKQSKNPTKRLHQEDGGLITPQANAASVSTNGVKATDKLPKGGNAKNATSNLIKINLSDNGQQQPAPQAAAVKSKATKKDKPAEKSNVIVIEQSPPSPKQKKKAPKKNKSDTKKQPETVKDGQSVNMVMKIDDPRDTSSSTVKTVELQQTPQQQQQQLHHAAALLQQSHLMHPQGAVFAKGDDEMANNFAMMMPNSMLNGGVLPDMLKHFSMDQMSSLIQTPGIENPFMVPKEDLYNFTKMFSGINNNDLEKLYLGFMPHFNKNN